MTFEPWIIMFACVSAVHLGLTDAIRNVVHHDVPVIGCVKCLTFWCVLLRSITTGTGFIHALAISFALAWCALWFDLLMGAADTLYLKIYEKLYDNPQGATSAEDTRQSGAKPQKDALP